MKNLIILLLAVAASSFTINEKKKGVSLDPYHKIHYKPRDGKYDQDHLSLGLGYNTGKRDTKTSGEDQTVWYDAGQAELQAQLAKVIDETKVKNVIFFIADGTGIGTLTAARLAKGTTTGNYERETMAWEAFPYTGIIKTYNTDMQVTDSAASSTAYATGSKANQATLGVDARVTLGNCDEMQNELYYTRSVLRDFQLDSRSTGIVTTTRVTHASPAGFYAHTAERHWENDDDINDEPSGINPVDCRDIAYQLIFGDEGANMKVILGGGRRSFLSKDITDDPEGCDLKRDDGNDLISNWSSMHSLGGLTPEYVWNKADLLAMDIASTDSVLGLFDCSHMAYAHEEEESNPSLAEMTEVAINMLKKDTNGFFLFVEGGMIDQAHHLNQPRAAIREVLEFEAAIASAVSLTSESDTLIIVTADHSQPLQINGYSPRNSDVLGMSTSPSDIDNLPYSTLMYTNGPGYRTLVDGKRPDESQADFTADEYAAAAAVPMEESHHSGEDVVIFARGPFSHLFTGIHENSYIPHAIRYAACVGTGMQSCTATKD